MHAVHYAKRSTNELWFDDRNTIMTAHTSLFAQLNDRRSRLGISKAQLSRRSGVAVHTVHRLLSGGETRPKMDTLSALAVALGVEVRLADRAVMHETTKVSAFRAKQAKAKAAYLAKLVQGTMALEAEAVDAEVLQEIEEANVHALLSGPSRRLWGD